MALDDELRTIQTKISQLTARKTRAEIELDNATAKRTEAQATLKEEFGVSTTAEAQAKLVELRAYLTDVIAEVESELEAAGA